jgi:hypothetical protein
LKNLKIQTGTKPEPVQTNRFRFGPFFLLKKPEKPIFVVWVFSRLSNGFSDGLFDGLIIDVNII